jgi:2-(3-amino-3-carboxypropyl)histidine synthase
MENEKPCCGAARSSSLCETNKNVANKDKAIVRSAKSSRAWKALNSIPDDILQNQLLTDAIKMLPDNYNFEVHKTVWKARESTGKAVALQFPEGLLMYSCLIADIIRRFSGKEVIILGDVTYGACCIDDFTANKLGASLLIHYGHSCLVPINKTTIKVMLPM